ncbi:hypothetical protein Scep_027252 [Stephania cephalantha]|uniref:Uncharacterized protein n=1 Tax=Stephania cephalantha TaxID=152367 RepID=A0AAP0HME2_9MAGN
MTQLEKWNSQALMQWSNGAAKHLMQWSSGAGERVDPLKVKQGERERFEKKQREEKARIDAHVKVAKEEAALKLLRQRQSADSHLRRYDFFGCLPLDFHHPIYIYNLFNVCYSIFRMEKSVDVYDDFAIMKDLEMMGVAKCIRHDRVLEGLGLYLKNEFPEDDGDDVEEGEIIC